MSKWISVEERLPDEKGPYIVSIDPNYCPLGCIYIDMLYFIDGKWQWFIDGKLEDWEDPILAWMPLPTPYHKEVADYCVNDVIATEAAFNYLKEGDKK